MITTIRTAPFNDQKMGTAGLRRKSKIVMQENYIENFMQSIFNVIGNLQDKTFLLGGDGRFYNDKAIILSIAKCKHLFCKILSQSALCGKIRA